LVSFLRLIAAPKAPKKKGATTRPKPYRPGFETLAAVGLKCEKGPYEGEKPRYSVYPATQDIYDGDEPAMPFLARKSDDRR
jgi:hypothetical protein